LNKLSVRAATFAGMVVAASVASAQIYSNGPLITHPGGGAGGADASALQVSTLGMNTFGFTSSLAGGFRVADDFVIPSGQTWNITGFRFFAYQTNSGTTSTFNDVRVQVYNGAPNGGGSVIFGDTVTNRISGTAFTNIYRVTDTTLTNNQRPIMSIDATAAMSLNAGTYWVEWTLGGTSASGPFVPPVTILGLGQKPGSNALQQTVSTGAWAAVVDTGNLQAQDLPFQIRGQVIPEPGTLIALGAGMAALLARRRRK
jgi:hypothetical protein